MVNHIGVIVKYRHLMQFIISFILIGAIAVTLFLMLVVFPAFAYVWGHDAAKIMGWL